MDFRTINATYYCGVDMHAKTSYFCILDRSGQIMLKRNLENNFALIREYLNPFLPDLALGCESTYNYYWLLDGCQQAGITFYLGHALYMKAISGNKIKNDPLDAFTIANLLRTSYFPEAYPYPKEMRATRDLLRRRHRLVRLRAEAYTHIQLIFHQYGILDIESGIVQSKTKRRQLIERFSEDDIRKNIATDLDVIDALDPVIAQLESQITRQAKYHRSRDYSILLTVPGVGPMIALNILYEMSCLDRFKSVQKFSSYCRVVKCERSSNNKTKKGGNQKIGNPYLKWAMTQIIISAQSNEHIAKYVNRLESKHGRRRARAQIAHKFAVAIFHMLKNEQVFDLKRFLNS
jgi:transposase